MRKKNVNTIIISISKSNSCGATGGTCGAGRALFGSCRSWRLEMTKLKYVK